MQNHNDWREMKPTYFYEIKASCDALEDYHSGYEEFIPNFQKDLELKVFVE
jgi:hypothetical protein